MTTTTTTASSANRTPPTSTPSAPAPPGLPPEKCPDPKTCRHHTFAPDIGLFPTGPDGRVTVEYWVNPSRLDTTTISVEEAEGALAAAFSTWQRAAPALRFAYRGRTERLALQGDGVNVVTFQGAYIGTYFTGNPAEFDMEFAPREWMWAPCEQRDGACTPVKRRTPTGTGYLKELQSIATHEVGHALGLGHVDDQDLDRWMTMYPGNVEDFSGSRHHGTLALGDVLGVRSLYPCECPLPTIYAP